MKPWRWKGRIKKCKPDRLRPRRESDEGAPIEPCTCFLTLKEKP